MELPCVSVSATTQQKALPCPQLSPHPDLDLNTIIPFSHKQGVAGHPRIVFQLYCGSEPTMVALTALGAAWEGIAA